MRALITPAVVFITISGIFFGFLVADTRNEEKLIRVQSVAAAEEFASRLESIVGDAVDAVAGLAEVWAETASDRLSNSLSDPLSNSLVDPEAEFLSRASALSDVLLAANWVTPEGVIEVVGPVGPNARPIGEDLLRNSLASPALRLADQTGTVQFTGPLTLAPDGLGFAAFIPVLADGSRVGFVHAVFSSEELLGAITRDEELLTRFSLQLFWGGDAYFEGDLSADFQDGARSRVSLGDSELVAVVAPGLELIGGVRSPVGEAVFAFGLLFAALVAWLTHRSEQTRSGLLTLTRRLEATLDAVPDLHIVLDSAGTVVDCRIPTGMLLSSICEMKGQRLGTVFPESVVAQIQDAMSATAKTGEPSSFEYDWEGENERHWFDARVLRMGEERFLLVARDVTQQRTSQAEHEKLVQQRQQAQKFESLGMLAGGVAHDFNNILTSILGNAELATKSVGPNGEAGAQLRQIGRSAERAAALCRQMLAYSGSTSVEMSPVDLSEVVGGLTELLSSSVSKKVSVEYDLEGDPPSSWADLSQLRQMSLNLIINAAEAVGDVQGRVHVRTGTRSCTSAFLESGFLSHPPPPGEYGYLEVADSGPGIGPEILPRVFDPFFTTKETGRGLGLAAVVGIVKAHGGTIVVGSSELGGARFTVLLPLYETSDTAPSESVPLDGEFRGAGKILVVDDEASVLELAATMVTRMGFETLRAHNGATALEKIHEFGHELSAVLLDVTMPDISGIDVLERARMDHPTLPIILTSGYTEQEACSRGANLSATAFLQKPYRLKKLEETILSAVGGSVTT